MSEKTEQVCYYLGKPYPLVASVDNSVRKITIAFNGEAFICMSPTEGVLDLNEALKSCYMKEAKKLIEKRLKHYQPQISTKYKAFAIENDNKKWGSCSSKKNLTFHWRLIMYPLAAVDYVVVHELCHLEHMNHDRSFWRLVGKLYPDYKSAMALIGSEKTRTV